MKVMIHLIDKDALVVEITDRICSYQEYIDSGYDYEDRKQDLEDLLLSINTLEVKEVDFERELSKYVSKGIHRFFPNEGDDYYNMDSVVWQDYVIETARHFFELGLKAQKGE